MLVNLLNNPLHFFHLLYFEDFLNTLKNDYYSQKEYLGKLSSKSDNDSIESEYEYVKIIFQEIRKLIVNNILNEVSNLKEFEIEDYIDKLNVKINNYTSINNQLTSQEEYSEAVLYEVNYIKDFIQVNYKEILENIEIKKNTSLYFKKGDYLTPFKFFEDLLFTDGFERLNKSYNFKTIHTKNYRYIFHSENGYFFESWVLKSDMSYQMDNSKYCIVVADFYVFEGLEIINNKQNDDDFKEYINIQLDVLYNYYSKIEDLRASQFELVNNSICKIVSTLYSKYKSLNINHKLYRIIIEGNDSKKSDFKPKTQLKIDLFIDLYNKSEELEIFDSEELFEDDFLNILVFKDISNEKKFKFKKSNPYVAYYLKSIELFFDNLNPLTIEKSEMFLNKQDKLIKSSDLYTALSRGNIEGKRLKNDVDLLIKEITEKHLK